jgi:peptidoglycan/xylan/chitin deacetylase (PgdA/CDA1 family)
MSSGGSGIYSKEAQGWGKDYKDGFEIGNHTRDHLGVTDKNVADLAEQVQAINERCKEHGIPAPVSFAYPGNSLAKDALPMLRHLGIKFARRGGSPEFLTKKDAVSLSNRTSTIRC